MGLPWYGLKGPHGDFERSTTSECRVLVPPSAHIRMYQPSWRERCGPSIQIGFFAGSTPPLTNILRGPTNFRDAVSNSWIQIARWPSYLGPPSGNPLLTT